MHTITLNNSSIQESSLWKDIYSVFKYLQSAMTYFPASLLTTLSTKAPDIRYSDTTNSHFQQNLRIKKTKIQYQHKLGKSNGTRQKVYELHQPAKPKLFKSGEGSCFSLTLSIRTKAIYQLIACLANSCNFSKCSK